MKIGDQGEEGYLQSIIFRYWDVFGTVYGRFRREKVNFVKVRDVCEKSPTSQFRRVVKPRR